MTPEQREQARATVAKRLEYTDTLRGRICRNVCFGVGDTDLPDLLIHVEALAQQSLDRAASELERLGVLDKDGRLKR